MHPFLPAVPKRGRKPTTDLQTFARCSTRCAISPGPVAAGGCCRTIFYHGRRFIGGFGGSFVACVQDDS